MINIVKKILISCVRLIQSLTQLAQKLLKWKSKYDLEQSIKLT